ncbi:hypothetical protein BDZ97DRAFT_1165956 [Flammula alnicola]|nr:hypothetical protein BDZ97DRAFT_1165956 [Flammula alnicola]
MQHALPLKIRTKALAMSLLHRPNRLQLLRNDRKYRPLRGIHLELKLPRVLFVDVLAMPLPSTSFFVSTLPVGQNAVKNILFRVATILLNFIILRLFAFLAFKTQDYTSFLMFSEDVIQKALYVFDRKLTRQTMLVAMFACLTGAAGFYDTLLWGLDSPGYVTKSTRVNAGVLSSEMLDSPAYITLISNPMDDLSRINLNDTFGANLYTTGLNFTLPGIIQPGFARVVPAVEPLSGANLVSPRIWLDSSGFAVGLDDAIMRTVTMNTTETFCSPTNVPNTNDTQVWRCNIRNSDAQALFVQEMGLPQIWWDLYHPEYLLPIHKDNPWQSLGTGGDTAVMKQVFTVTKGSQKHTFLQTTFKGTMIGFPPLFLDDGEITDFMRRTWSTSDSGQPLPPAVQSLADLVISAKNNQTSLTFGSFIQGNDTVYSYSTEYLNFAEIVNGTEHIIYGALRFVSTTIAVIRSEVLFHEPTPFAPCNLVYRNIATGGVVRSTNCYDAAAAENQSVPATGGFLGQIDTSSVVIMSDILGDGTTNTSVAVLNQTGIDWYNNVTDHIDQLLISRGLILGGNRPDVMVDVQHTEAAISHLQLLLTLLPVLLALLVLGTTFRQPMSYFKNSFMAAVFATTHVSSPKCSKIGYMRSPPEVTLKVSREHTVLGTRHGGTIAIVGANQLIAPGMSYEPLLQEKDDVEQRTEGVI